MVHRGSLSNASPKRAILSALLIVLIFIISLIVTAVPEDEIDDVQGQDDDASLENLSAADTAWMMTSCALVFLMTPGVSFFYGGMVRRTSLISTLLQSYVIMGLVLMLWIIFGFSLVFSDSWGNAQVIGNPSTYYFFKNVGVAPNTEMAATISFTVFAMFQATFAMITPALITGAVAERANFNALMFFVAIWHVIVYCPIAHMEWHPRGLLKELGHKDFAGGTVVHMSSGYSALMLAYLVGVRGGDKATHHSPAHIPYVMLGTGLLWFGWFGFNGGSALGANASAAQAVVTTCVAAGTGMCTWVLWDYVQGRKASAIGACGGLVIGLVVITPGCGFVTVGGSMIMAMIGAIVSNVALHWFKNLSMVDDTLDVWACHGFGGTVGVLLTACFATDRVYDDGLNGLFYGEWKLFFNTCLVCLLCIPYFLLMTYLIYHFVNFFVPFRVSIEDEKEGLDRSYHGEAVETFNLLMNTVTENTFLLSNVQRSPRIRPSNSFQNIPLDKYKLRSKKNLSSTDLQSFV